MRRRSTCVSANSVWRRLVLCRGSRWPESRGVAAAELSCGRARPAAAGAPGDLRRPRPRTALTRDRRSGDAPAGASGIRSGSGRRIVSRHAWPGTSRECEHSSCGAPSCASRCASRPRPERRRSCRGSRGARTSRSGAAPPTYASAVRFAIIHHTAGRNDYSRPRPPRSSRGFSSSMSRERLERHRLQLSRRSLRHDLRGPLRRHRSERRRVRTHWGSTRAPSASRSSERMATPSRPRRHRPRSLGSSRGGSISHTSIPPRSSPHLRRKRAVPRTAFPCC